MKSSIQGGGGATILRKKKLGNMDRRIVVMKMHHQR